MTPPRSPRLLPLLLPLLLAACASGGEARDAAPPAAGPRGDDARYPAPPVPAPRPAAPAGAAAAAPADPAHAQGRAGAAADGPDPAVPPPPDTLDAPAAEPPAAAAEASVPTQAELDYAAIYGQAPYDPVADPTLPDPVQLPASYDPWEGWNRRVHRFNNAVDRTIAKPLARFYVKVVPRPVRLGVGNFFSNLGQPVSALNALLQGRPGHAGQSLGRFLVNATLGIGGLFDPATAMNIPNRSEDF